METLEIPIYFLNKSKKNTLKIKDSEQVITFSQFCKIYSRSPVIKEREKDVWRNNIKLRYYLSCGLIEEIKCGILNSICGNGETPKSALKDFIKNISRKHILIGGHTGIEVFLPKVVLK